MNYATKEDIIAKPELIHKCWAWLNDNFHKFKELTRLKVALELVKKDLPNKVEGSIKVTMMPEIKMGETPLEFDIGATRFDSTGDAEYSGETKTSTN